MRIGAIQPKALAGDLRQHVIASASHLNPRSICESYPDLPRSRRRHTRDHAEIGLRDGQDRVVILRPVERVE